MLEAAAAFIISPEPAYRGRETILVSLQGQPLRSSAA